MNAATSARTARRRGRLPASLVLTAGLLLGCEDAATRPAAPPSSTPSEAPPPASASASPAPRPGGGLPLDHGLHSPWRRTEIDVPGNAGRSVVVERIAATSEEEHDRLVFHFRGDTPPGYRIGYVTPPIRTCGAGHELALPGKAWLAITFEPAQAHDDTGEPTAVPPTDDELEIIREVVRQCDFEGRLSWIVALDGPRHFRAELLDAPLRMVVDVAHR